MELQFRNVITLMLISGFFLYTLASLMFDVFVFGISPSDSKMAFMLAGSLVGFCSGVVAFLYVNTEPKTPTG